MACGLVILTFSHQGYSADQWANIETATLSLITDILVKSSTTFECKRRVLDTTPGGEVRVVENIVFIGGPSMSQVECTQLTHDKQVIDLQQTLHIELVIQPLELYKTHKQPGLAVFDMDSTLIQQEVIDELARVVGVYDQVAAITEAAMRGEAPYTDFEGSLRARVSLLKGVPSSVWEQLREGIITFTPGVKETCFVLKRLGWRLAVLSGGFTPLATWVKETLELDYAHANFLEVGDDGFLTGKLVEGRPIVHAQRKQVLLQEIARENGIPLNLTIAVGDGSNDLAMMAVAGLGVAFNAKPKVQLAAPTRLNSTSMLDLLHILGYDQTQIQTALS